MLALFLFPHLKPSQASRTMTIETPSPCKVNLLLNILGRRTDGFHNLETVMQPVPLFDRLTFKRAAGVLELTCSEPSLPTDSGNLVYRAAEQFLQAARIHEGVRMHLEKRIPLAAGLGGGSANAAGHIDGPQRAVRRSARRGPNCSCSPPASAPMSLSSSRTVRPWGTGRGEIIQPLDPVSQRCRAQGLLLIHPGFGVATAWAYQQLARYPAALNGEPGRAQRLIQRLQTAGGLPAAAGEFYNSLESARAGQIPLAGAVPGVPPRQRREGDADVGERLDHVRDRGEPGGGGGARGESQG